MATYSSVFLLHMLEEHGVQVKIEFSNLLKFLKLPLVTITIICDNRGINHNTKEVDSE